MTKIFRTMPDSGICAAITCLVLALSFSAVPKAAADSWNEIVASGTIHIGVKIDTPPFGYHQDGELVGLDIDLAREFATEIGMELILVPVVTATRINLLLGGEIDVIIATLSDTPKRRDFLGIIDPGYFATGASLMARKDAIRTWDDLSGRAVCGVKGAYYNQLVRDFYRASVVPYRSLELALFALDAGDCIALLYDEAILSFILAGSRWSDFELPAEPIEVESMAAAVRLQDLKTHLGTRLSQFFLNMHCDGRILKLLDKYSLRPNRYLLKLRKEIPCN